MVCDSRLVHDQSPRLVVLYHDPWQWCFASVRLARGTAPIFHELDNAGGLAYIVRRTKHAVELDALI
eukprot:6062938-Pyramimonas_sp.AAC.1